MMNQKMMETSQRRSRRSGLLTVILIGLVVENLILRTIERNTVQKWGTQL
jgi:hypothetical protein